MAAGLRLELRQSQQLVMTPQLQQAIKLLQMSNLELSRFVAEEVERNPLLALDEAGEGVGEASPADPTRPDPTHPEPVSGAPADPTAAEAPAIETTDARLTSDGDLNLAAETFDTGTENLYDAARADAPGERLGRVSGGALPDGDAPDFEARLTAPPSLRAHLLAQLGQIRADATTRTAARLLVEELDEDGYLRTPPEEMAERLGLPPAALERAVELVQRCEPTGVGARSLAECFALQLSERNRLDPIMRCFLDHLDLIASGQLAKLRRLCGADEEDIPEMIAELRTLDPRPGARFGEAPAETAVPDVFLRRAQWGGWRLELNTDTLPRVLMDQSYAAVVSSATGASKTFLSACRDDAAWLIKSLDQRARTILKVATEIVSQQERFFSEGAAALQPLSLRMVADAIGMHESTVSRVTSNKYMATERGTFELKFFFSNAVGAGAAGGGTSSEAIRQRIKAMVAGEPADAVLSDDQIVETLRADGIDVARRTVAKYRKSLGIPSSVERRRRNALNTFCTTA
ncbi:MAG: RNA polymerase factor sigma-54 [Paracoccaceae bacterium]